MGFRKWYNELWGVEMHVFILSAWRNYLDLQYNWSQGGKDEDWAHLCSSQDVPRLWGTALNKLEALNDALKGPNKVICYVIYSVCLFKAHIFSHWILCVKQLSFGSRRSLSQRSLCRLILTMILTLLKMCRWRYGWAWLVRYSWDIPRDFIKGTLYCVKCF